jgi:hypothetical protein
MRNKITPNLVVLTNSAFNKQKIHRNTSVQSFCDCLHTYPRHFRSPVYVHHFPIVYNHANILALSATRTNPPLRKKQLLWNAFFNPSFNCALVPPRKATSIMQTHSLAIVCNKNVRSFVSTLLCHRRPSNIAGLIMTAGIDSIESHALRPWPKLSEKFIV